VAGVGGPGKAGYTFMEAGSLPISPTEAGWGVLGFGGDGDGAGDIPSNAKDGVAANPGVGFYGQGGFENGAALPGSGVIGLAGDGAGGSPYYLIQGFGVVGGGLIGVYGFSETGDGVLGLSWDPDASGVLGIAEGGSGGRGVTGQARPSETGNTTVDHHTYAIHGLVVPPPQPGAQGPYAGWFDGPVAVNGDLTVYGMNKSVAVPFADGSHRRLYCMESPECWFEDFGEAKLVKGKAQIKLPRDFAAVIQPDSYHVFLTPYGHSNGLCVSKRTRQGFVVEEQGRGKSSLNFAFRIVGKRKGFKAERFAKVAMPKPPKPPKLPAGFKLKDSKVKEKLPTKPSIRPPSGALSAD
jgi:hypothetical protein